MTYRAHSSVLIVEYHIGQPTIEALFRGLSLIVNWLACGPPANNHPSTV